MADGVSIKLQGADELQRVMSGFSAAAQRRIARPAIREASTPVLRAIRKNAPPKRGDRTGALRKSLKRVIRTYKHNGVVMAIIGPDKHYVASDIRGNRVVPNNYAHLVEFGTAAHSMGRGSNSRKGVGVGGMHPGAKPKPFMRPGWESTRSGAMATMSRRMWIEIEKEAERQRAKHARRSAK